MCLWSVALKARKAAKWPRTFYMVWTVYELIKKFGDDVTLTFNKIDVSY